MEVLTTNHYEKIMDLFEEAQETVKIISPFISDSIAKKLCDIVKGSSIKCQFITRFYLEDMYAKANSIDAIKMMMQTGIEVYALKGLHTKLYLFDAIYAVLGSANFTAGGFKSNVELSLLMGQDDNILHELHTYFDEMLDQIKQSDEGLITEKVLDLAWEKYKTLLSGKKDKEMVRSTYMYGASLDNKTKFEKINEKTTELDKCRNESDIVNELFKFTEQSSQILLDHTAWLKFYGEGNDRLEAEKKFVMPTVSIGTKKYYLSNYSTKVHSVKENDEIYLAMLTTDIRGKNLPIIIGRGYLMGFEEDNVVNQEWIKNVDWMNRYPWYCIIRECTVLNTVIKNGIPLDEVWDKFGSDTYVASFGRNEPFSSVAIKHYQNAHIRLSGNAKEFIDKRLDELGNKYGVIKYLSDIKYDE